jgi:hypothetical protein
MVYGSSWLAWLSRWAEVLLRISLLLWPFSTECFGHSKVTTCLFLRFFMLFIAFASAYCKFLPCTIWSIFYLTDVWRIKWFYTGDSTVYWLYSQGSIIGVSLDNSVKWLATGCTIRVWLHESGGNNSANIVTGYWLDSWCSIIRDELRQVSQ